MAGHGEKMARGEVNYLARGMLLVHWVSEETNTGDDCYAANASTSGTVGMGRRLHEVSQPHRQTS